MIIVPEAACPELLPLDEAIPAVEQVFAAMGRGEINVDWGMGEHMAFASLVAFSTSTAAASCSAPAPSPSTRATIS